LDFKHQDCHRKWTKPYSFLRLFPVLQHPRSKYL
jgi:hypothetical protein